MATEIGQPLQQPETMRPAGRVASYCEELKDNVRYRSLWEEISGSLGDLGTFVPIVIALTLVNGLDLGTTLLFTGAFNIITGAMFGVPMPVQPMKSIAAAALTPGDLMTIPQIMAAGITTGAILVGLGATGLMTLVNFLVPLPVVRGIQLSQGLAFGITAVKYMLYDQNFAKGKQGAGRAWLGLDSKLLAIVALCFIVLVSGAGEYTINPFPKDSIESSNSGAIINPNDAPRKRTWVEKLRMIPTALSVFVLGIILAFVRDPSIAGHLRVGPATPKIPYISARDWRIGFVRGTIPQVPLSVLNSVIAVCKLSNDLFPTKLEVTPMKVSTSVGLMNLVGCWFGAMPTCHGCGGLAGQYRFGARSGISVVFLGTFKLLLSLLLGGSLLQILAKFPVALLGVLLLFSGLELAMTCRDQNTRTEVFIMLSVTAVSIATSNAGLGFGCGMALVVLLKARERKSYEILWRLTPWGKRRNAVPGPNAHQV
ncbi:hypothetical protein M758_2G136900 [Ceratodon purpureus]|nr:hypothetical protein M758_2G136900 [Ceratodon purpureus]